MNYKSCHSLMWLSPAELGVFAVRWHLPCPRTSLCGVAMKLGTEIGTDAGERATLLPHTCPGISTGLWALQVGPSPNAAISPAITADFLFLIFIHRLVKSLNSDQHTCVISPGQQGPAELPGCGCSAPSLSFLPPCLSRQCA